MCIRDRDREADRDRDRDTVSLIQADQMSACEVLKQGLVGKAWSAFHI